MIKAQSIRFHDSYLFTYSTVLPTTSLRLRDIFAAHVGVGTPALAFFHRRWQLVFESVLKLVGAGRVCVFSIVVFVYVVRLWFAVFSGRQLCAVFVITRLQCQC